jgi:hypothetical protein
MILAFLNDEVDDGRSIEVKFSSILLYDSSFSHSTSVKCFLPSLSPTHLCWLTQFSTPKSIKAIAEAIESFYTYWPDPSDVWRIRERFVDLLTDAYYTQPVAQSAHLHSDTGSRTWLYVGFCCA